MTQYSAELKQLFPEAYKSPNPAWDLEVVSVYSNNDILELTLNTTDLPDDDICALKKEILSVYSLADILFKPLENNKNETESEPVRAAVFSASVSSEDKYEIMLKELAEKERYAAAEAIKAAKDAEEPRVVLDHKALKDSVIYGKISPGELTTTNKINEGSGKVSVEGTIFSVANRKLNGKEKTSISFDITDSYGAIRISKLFDDETAKKLLSSLSAGKTVVVQGNVSFNKYEDDITISPSCIVLTASKMRDDNAEVKRVELHLHTNMSTMDGICDPDLVIKLAAHMGHPAVAITDHGVVQAYPEAAAAAKKYNIKVIYGIEAYCVNDLLKSTAVKGTTDAKLTDEIVVFDLETTGLNAYSCEIIEIAASIVADGKVKDKYHSYVKPLNPIPQKITDLTGITDEKVKDARSICEVLPEFLSFCGERPMCAHNADFDISFLSAACRAQRIDKTFCSIDTVEISRALMPELSKHRLNNIADALGLKFNHHRASDDSDVLAEIFIRFIDLLRERCDISRVDEINQALSMLKSRDSGTHGRAYHFIILVKTQEGLKDLYRLVSDSHLKYYKRFPIIPMSLLEENRENFLFGSACEAGELFTAIENGKTWDELVKIASFYDYLEIQPLSNNIFLLDEGKVDSIEQLKEMNRTVIKLGQHLNKPVCATGDVHYIEKNDRIFRDILMQGKGFEPNSEKQDFSFRSTDQMLKEFTYLGEEKAYEVVVTNTRKIADMCGSLIPLKSGTYPPSVENSAEDLKKLVYKKLDELYLSAEGIPELIKNRLEAELVPIIEHGYDVMYMIAQKLVQKSNSDGYLVGSRGSVGSSFVAFLAGITEVNALPPHYRCPKCKHTVFEDAEKYEAGVDMPDRNCPLCGEKMKKDGFNIPFATFLGFNCDKAPDIDLNFSSEYQQRIHNETIRLFGVDRVFKAGTISKIKDKTAYGFVKHYFEEKKQPLPHKAELNRLVYGCTGVKRTTGQHPGGLIIVPHDMEIYDFSPVQHPADKSGSDIITTHFDYHSIHDNLLKLDLLGHDDPTMIRKLYDVSGINPQEIPLDDPETMSIFTDIHGLNIETDDILEDTGAAALPEFGTKFVRGMLVDTQPHSFSDLVRISGLSHGTDVWLNNANNIIKEGLGTIKDVICVRDDITLKLIASGIEPKVSFNISEKVRKGKGLTSEWEDIMKEHGLPQWYINSCNKIKYMFPRAHAAAYVIMAFRIAWFKVHRPLDFYCAFFSIRSSGFDATYMANGDGEVSRRYRELRSKQNRSSLEDDVMSTLEICHEFYKRGFSFLPIDIYKSEVNGFKKEGNALRLPFTSLPGLGEAAAQSICDERLNGNFISADDIIHRCDKVSKAVIESLSLCGALKTIPKSNQLELDMFL